jgi:DinB superfamily
MTSAEILTDAFGRVSESVHEAAEGLTTGQLVHRIDGEANTIAWLLWHLSRVQDDHVAGVAGTEQVWTSAGWAKRLGIEALGDNVGYGHSSDQVAMVRCSAGELLGYFDEVHEATIRFVSQVTDADLDRVVDERFDPPVTLGARLVSVISDDLQHVGQAAYVRGIVERAQIA